VYEKNDFELEEQSLSGFEIIITKGARLCIFLMIADKASGVKAEAAKGEHIYVKWILSEGRFFIVL